MKVENLFCDISIYLHSRFISLFCQMYRDIVIQQLHQQIDDLMLILEEERLNHKMNTKKVRQHVHVRANHFFELEI